MTGPNGSISGALDQEAMFFWDLLPDEHAPSTAIIMRFASYEAAHTVLTNAGFTPASASMHAPRRDHSGTAVEYTHPDGHAVVLAHQPTGRHRWRAASSSSCDLAVNSE